MNIKVPIIYDSANDTGLPELEIIISNPSYNWIEFRITDSDRSIRISKDDFRNIAKILKKE